MNAATTAAVLATTLAAGSAIATSPITVTITGILAVEGGLDGNPVRIAPDGLDGANFTLEATLDAETVYERSLNLPAAAFQPGATLTIEEATDDQLNGIYFANDAAFFPTLAGVLAYPNGFFNGFDAVREDGTTLHVFGMLNPAAGASNVALGRTIEIDDFNGATNDAFTIALGEDTYAAQSLTVSAATIPTPAAAAVLGLAGLTATRRRR